MRYFDNFILLLAAAAHTARAAPSTDHSPRANTVATNGYDCEGEITLEGSYPYFCISIPIWDRLRADLQERFIGTLFKPHYINQVITHATKQPDAQAAMEHASKNQNEAYHAFKELPNCELADKNPPHGKKVLQGCKSVIL